MAVAARDRPGLFADLAATLSMAGADVVGARLATADDGMALDVPLELSAAGLARKGEVEGQAIAR